MAQQHEVVHVIYVNQRAQRKTKIKYMQIMQNKHSILIIGIGNPYRGDDAVGLRIAQDIKKKSPDHVNVIEQSGDGISLMDSWKDANTVILIDAVYSGGKFGPFTDSMPTNKPYHQSFSITLHMPSVLLKPLNLQGHSNNYPKTLVFTALKENVLKRVSDYLWKLRKQLRKL